MAGSCTVNLRVLELGASRYPYDGARIVEWTWLSHTDGTVSGVGSSMPVSGRIEQIHFIPDSGASAPDDNHSISLLDSRGLDWCVGLGASVRASRTDTSNVITPLNAQSIQLYLVDEILTPSISGAGAAKGGIIRMVLR